MHDPFAWSIPLGRLFGITVRIHWFFPFAALGLVLHVALYTPDRNVKPIEGAWIDAALLMGVLFLSVLVHEFAHCFAARWMHGDAQEVLLWPLGGLANVELPHRPLAHFVTAAAGPASNAIMALIAGILLLVAADKPYQPIWNPLPEAAPYRDSTGKIELTTWAATEGEGKVLPYSSAAWLARVWWVNWFSFLLNVVLVGFPMDGGRMLQSALWPSVGYRRATLTAIFAGFAVVFIVGLYAIVTSKLLALCLALFIYVTCQRQWVVLEMGGEEGLFGYDFSQGYTSLERDQVQAAPPARPRVSWWRRWLQRRATRKIQRETEVREAEERRLDELLEKIRREGKESLTDEEKRFMKRVSDRYRNNRR